MVGPPAVKYSQPDMSSEFCARVVSHLPGGVCGERCRAMKQGAVGDLSMSLEELECLRAIDNARFVVCV